ncbi:hypothetical protein D9M68_895840 [compost metagenome]
MQIALFAQQLVELWFHGPDRNALAVRALVCVVKMCSSISVVGASLVAPEPSGVPPLNQRSQQGRTVGDGCIDDLSSTCPLCMGQRCQDAKGQQHATTTKISDQAGCDRWRLASASGGVQCA